MKKESKLIAMLKNFYFQIGGITLLTATALTAGISKSIDYDKARHAKEIGISIEQLEDYQELGVDWPNQISILNDAGFTAERLNSLKEKGIASWEVFNAIVQKEGSNVKPTYEQLVSKGIPPREVLEYIQLDVPIERVIEWKEAEKNVKRLIYRPIELVEAKRLVIGKGIDTYLVSSYLIKGANPSLIDTLIEANISPEKVRNGYGQLDWEDTEQHKRWLLAGFKDSDLELCVEKNHSLEEAKKWREADYSVEEMHKYLKLVELLEL